MRSCLWLLFIVCLLNQSCDKTKECISYAKSPVTGVTGPTNAQVNQLVYLNVAFQVYNGCGQFDKFATTENGNTLMIDVEAKYDGCLCTADLPTRYIQFAFKAVLPGTYTLKFLQTNGVYLDHVIVVN